ncbi:MAG: sugar phosphate isomerase/epimerase [Cyclobacteriaceae bacterium]
MNRRDFVKQGSAFAAGSIIPISCSGPKKEQAMTEPVVEKPAKGLTNFGLQLYTLRNELPNGKDEVLQKVSEIGFQQLEMYMFEGQHHLGWPVNEFKQKLDDLGLKVISTHVPTGNGAPDTPGTFINGFDKVIEEANILGQKYLVCPYLTDSERTSLDDYKKILEMLNNAGEKCNAAGIQLCYHNHDFEFEEMEGEVPLLMMLENSDKATLQFELDIYWSTRGGFDALELFNKYPGRFPLWHVKDMSKTDPMETTYVGAGSIDFANILKNSGNSGLDIPIVEQEHYPIPVYEGLEKSHEFMRTVEI